MFGPTPSRADLMHERWVTFSRHGSDHHGAPKSPVASAPSRSFQSAEAATRNRRHRFARYVVARVGFVKLSPSRGTHGHLGVVRAKSVRYLFVQLH